VGYLIHIGLALLAQVAWEEGLLPSTPRLGLVLALACVPHLLSALTRRLYLRGRFGAAERCLLLLGLSPALLHAVAVLQGGWIELLERWAGRSARLMDWPTPLLLATLAPLAVYTLISIEARSRALGGSRALASASWRFQTRLFAASLLPIAGYVMISWSLGLIPNLREGVETVALWNAAYAAAMLLLFAACVPWLLRNTWETQALPESSERSLLESVATLADFRCKQLFVWRTGQSVANAAIIGLFPRQRVVLFSDLLLAQLDLRQLASVFAHEIGHAKHHHVSIFAAWAFAALFGADLLSTQLFPGDPLWSGAVLAAAMGAWALGFGWMSRRFELQADLYSLRLLGDPNPLIQALEEVSGAHGRARTSWRHFSTERRVAFLVDVSRDPRVGQRLERRLAWLARAGFLGFVLVMGLELRGLIQQWPRDRVVLELRQGDYAQAASRLEHARIEDADLLRLVGRGTSLERGDAAELEARAREAFAQREFQAAADWLDLGALRGDAAMAQVRGVLSATQAEPRPGLGELRAAVPAAWQAALQPLWRSLGP